MNKKFIILSLFLIVLTSGFLRFYNNKGLSNFTYDQARDALYIKRIIIDHKFRLIGQQSSIPGLYTPPFYYYLMAPFLLLFKMDPKGLDYTTAFFGVLTVVLLYFTLKEIGVNKVVSLLVSLLYGASPEIVSQSRYAWNPNIIPFFTLLAVFSLIKILSKGRNIYFYISLFVSLGMIINLHYSGLVFLVPFLILLFINRNKIDKKEAVFGFLFLLVLLLPVIIFDLRHNFSNTRGVIEYVLHNSRNEVSPPPFLLGLFQKYNFLVGLLVPIQKFKVAISIGLLGVLAYYISKFKDKKTINITFILFLSIFLSSFYARGFYSFYLTFLFPLPFLLFGKLFSWKNGKPYLIFSNVILVALLALTLNSSIKQISPVKQDTRSKLQSISGLLQKEAIDPFNLVSINVGEGRFGNNAVDYRYFLETFHNKKALDWDPVDYENAKNLYVISEAGQVNPMKTNIWEIETFKPLSLKEEWNLNGIYVYHLVN